MIPISAEQVLEYQDKEDGITYLFRPLIGDMELIFFKYITANKNGEKDYFTSKEHFDLTNEMFNAATIGWRGSGNLPKYPEDKKPHNMFKIIDKTKLLTVYIELNGLTEDEKKK